jgi:ABC-type multidrug transport system fused ATPase/permease subunit
MQTPDLLILDEPLSNLDIKTSIHIMKLLKELDIPIILTLHHPNNIILESVDQLIVMEEGEISLNTSLMEISNRLEYYEQQVLGIEKKRDENTTTVTAEVVSLEIIDYKSYISTGFLMTKIYNAFYNIFKYISRNKTYQCAILFSHAPLIIYYILLNGTNFQDNENGYFYLTNNVYSTISSIIPVVAVNLFESEKMIHFMKYFGNINLTQYKFFFIIYPFLTWLTSTAIYLCLYNLVISYLSPNNINTTNTVLYISLFSKFLEAVIFNSLMYIFETISLTNAFWGIYCIFQYINSGQQTKQYPELKNYSIYYHLMNILSVKAQEVYNYPLLANGEPIYTLYGYSKDISNSYYYIFGFFIIPFLIYTCYNKKSKMFLT